MATLPQHELPAAEIALVQQHLEELVESAAFRGSPRSGQFLKHVVERAIEGHQESLKERIIGVELFGRLPTYDTSEDPIVRVTASDVRKRLLQYYGSTGANAAIRIHLPAGCYVPEVKHLPHESRETTSPAPLAEAAPVAGESVDGHSATPASRRPRIQWLVLAALFLAANLALWWLPRGYIAQPASASFFPWPVFLDGPHATLIVTSDPSIDAIQQLTGVTIPVSDYAAQRYYPANATLPPEKIRAYGDLLRGDRTTNVDVQVVASIVALAQSRARNIIVRGARELLISDLDSDNNFIFLGAPRSNPWVALFDDKLDFTLVYDKVTDQEIVRNAHPRSGESAQYIPSEMGYASRGSFATISYIANPQHAGQVLLLEGTNAGGAKAAGELATNAPNLAAALAHCGRGAAASRHFQILLGVDTMARSPRSVKVLACHFLP